MSCRALALGSIVTAMVTLSCSSAQRAQLVKDSGACVLDQVDQTLEDKAKSSAMGTGQEWATFSQGELLSHGVALAICIMAAVVKSVDRALPGDVAADAGGRVSPMALVANSSNSSAPSCSNPALLLAHDRAVDFLARYGVDHAHGPAVRALP